MAIYARELTTSKNNPLQDNTSSLYNKNTSSIFAQCYALIFSIWSVLDITQCNLTFGVYFYSVEFHYDATSKRFNFLFLDPYKLTISFLVKVINELTK